MVGIASVALLRKFLGALGLPFGWLSLCPMWLKVMVRNLTWSGCPGVTRGTCGQEISSCSS